MQTQLTPEQKERIRKLVHVLRTTKKTQGRSRLAQYVTPNKKEYCCLGIACEVAIAGGLELGRRKEEHIFYGGRGEQVVNYNSPEGWGSETVLPITVRDWFGFEDSDPTLIDEHGDRTYATALNDDYGYTFNRIADAFERTYLSEKSDENNNNNKDGTTK